MYARVARFEGADPSRIDELVGEMKQQLAAARSGELPPEAPPEAKTLMETVSRFMQLVDRSSGTSVGIAFAASEEDIRRADAVLSEMSPPEGGGTRTALDIFEVVVDESLR